MAEPTYFGGLVNPNLFGNQSNRDWWQRPRDTSNRPHSAMDFGASSGGSGREARVATVNRPRPAQFDDLSGDFPPIGFSGGGTSGVDYRDSIGGPTLGPSISPNVLPVQNRPHAAMDFGPEASGSAVVSPRTAFGGEALASGNSLGLPTNPGLDTGPDLFGNNRAINAFDEWWRTGERTAPSLTVNPGESSNTGGSIWEGSDTLGSFVGDTSIGRDLSADLASLGYGEGYPETLPATDPNLIVGNGDPTGIPVEPDPLNQNPDTEWTTSPEERRFLPTPEDTTTPDPAAERTAVSGLDLRTFGAPSNNMSLGAFLNASLGSMRFGESYPNIRGDGLMTGVVTAGGQVDMWGNQIDDVGGRWVSGPTGDTWVEDSPGSTRSTAGGQPSSTGTSTGTSPSVGYYDWGSGGVRALHGTATARDPNPNQRDGRGPSGLSEFANFHMWFAGLPGTPNNTGTNSENERTLFPGQIGRLNEFGEYEQTGSFPTGFRTTETEGNRNVRRSLIYGSGARAGVGGRGRGG